MERIKKCARCGRFFAQKNNLGRWECRQHVSPERYDVYGCVYYPCCFSRVGCVRADHVADFPTFRYTSLDHVKISVNDLEEFGIKALDDAYIDEAEDEIFSLSNESVKIARFDVNATHEDNFW